MSYNVAMCVATCLKQRKNMLFLGQFKRKDNLCIENE